jgi:predicted nucleic acid-binding protein
MIVLDTDVLIEIFDKRSVKGDEALRELVKSMQSPLGVFRKFNF